MWEKLLVPLAFVLVYVLLSGGFMLGVGGDTARMRVVFRAATLFLAAMVYSMAWHKQLGWLFGFPDAWILTTVMGAVGAVIFARYQFRKSKTRANSDPAT